MPLLRRFSFLLPLLLALWHAPSHAKLKFGEIERLRHVADTTLTDKNGAKLYLARKLAEKHFLLPYSLEDQGYVLGVSGDSRAYYPMPVGEKLAALQRAGYLPTPLPPYQLDTLDRLFGHALWLMLAGLVLCGSAHWAWRRRRAARAAPQPEVSSASPQPALSPIEAPPALTVTLPLRLEPRRLQLAGWVVVGLIFSATGVLMTREHPVIGALIAAFGALSTASITLQMLPGASYLALDAEGFTTGHFFRARRVRWRDVDALGVVRIQGRAMVAWDYAPSYDGNAKHHKVSQAVAGFDAALSHSFGMHAAELAELMNQIRLHHLHSQPPTPA